MDAELLDQNIYSVKVLQEYLKQSGFPYSLWWIRKQEAKGNLPKSTPFDSYRRRYTGKQIKDYIKKLRDNVYGNI